MPITQERMLALIYAAADFEQAYEKFRQFTILQNQHVKAGRVSAETAIQLCADAVELHHFLVRPVESQLTIRQEAKHFTASKQRENARRAARQARQRRASGTPVLRQSTGLLDAYTEATAIRLTPAGGTAPRAAPSAALAISGSLKDDVDKFLAKIALDPRSHQPTAAAPPEALPAEDTTDSQAEGDLVERDISDDDLADLDILPEPS